MDKLLLWLAVLTSLLSGAFSQRDLQGKVFVFPRQSATDYVKLIPQLEKPLENFTLCFRSYSDLSRPHSLFSYSAGGEHNEILLFKEKLGEYSLYIANTGVTSYGKEEFASPVHLCTSWESSSGIVEFWVNGKPWVRKGVQKGYAVKHEPSIIIGQEQDSYGGGFSQDQSFVGEIGDLYMWDYVLDPEDIQGVYHGSTCDSNVLDWQALNYEASDYVVIKPRVWG